jgi:hypothetical protein
VSKAFRPVLSAALVVTVCGLAAIVPVTAAPPVSAGAARVAAQRPAPAPTDRFIVGFRADAPERGNATARQKLLDGVGRKLGVRVSHGRKLANGADLLRTGHALDAHAAKRLLVELRKDPRVAFVEVDRRHRAYASPNDPIYPQQTYLMKDPGGLGFDVAWTRTTGDGVVVAVLDSGLTAHPDLDANVLAGGYDFVTDTGISSDGDGRDADPSDPGGFTCGGPVSDFPWHGTAVAGVIAAATDNGIGVAGAARDAKLLPVRVLGYCGGFTSDIADAIVWASGGSVAGVPANAHPAEVINLSLGTDGACGATLQAAVDTANANGAVVVAAAGDGLAVSADDIAPGNCDDVISVGVSGQYGSLANTAFGTTIDVFAPAGYLPFQPTFVSSPIQTTVNLGDGVVGEPGYGYGYGSSLSAAFASATVALMQARRPQSPNVVATLLRATAMDDQVYPTCPEGHCDGGIISADAATLALETPAVVVGGMKSVDEGTGDELTPVAIEVNLTEPVATPVSFTARTVAKLAVPGEDYVALAPTVFTFAPGETSKTITVNLIPDDVPEAAQKYFDVELSNVTGATLVAYPLSVIIRDDDGPYALAPDLEQVPVFGQENRFVFLPPAGATDVTVTISDAFGAEGDADLYASAGTPPTLAVHDCAGTTVGVNETCDLGTSVGGEYHAWVTTPTSWTGDIVLRVSWHQPAEISIADARKVEGASGTSSMVFTVTRTPVSLSSISFNATATDGTTTAGVDYTAPNPATTLSFAPGQATRKINVPIKGDTALEPNETFTLALSNASGATIVDGTATGTILNDEGPTLAVGDATLLEGNAGTKLATVTVTLSEASASAVTFDIATANGTATAGSDYVAKSLVAQSIPAGQTSANFTFTVNGDTATEADETVFVDLANASVSATNARGTVVLDNDDGPALSVGDVSIDEGNAGTRVATFTVQLAQATSHPVSFVARTAGGTATADVDYRGHAVVGTIPAGMLATTVQVAILGDNAAEPNETFQLQLSEPVNAVLGDAVAVGTIVDDEMPALSVADVKVTEGNAGTKSAVFTIVLSRTSGQAVSFDIATTGAGTATAGVDYVPRALAGHAIPAGQLSRTFAVTLNGDTTPEANETFVVALTNPVNGRIADGSALGTIVNDDDVPALSIADVAVAEGNSGTKVATFTATLSHTSPAAVSFNLATTGAGTASAGSDYVALASTPISIPAGQLAKTVNVTIQGDDAIEANETFVVSASGVTAATVADGSAVGTITNDDAPALSIGDVTVTEGNSGTKFATFTATLSRTSPFPVSFDAATSGAGTATAGTDYTAMSLNGLTVPAGSLTKVFNVTIHGDTTIENSETFVVLLSNVANATLVDGNALGTIGNDDKPVLTIADVALTEGNSGTKNAVFTVSISQAAPFPVTFNFATTGAGTATSGVDYVAKSLNGLQIPAGQTSKTVAVTLNGDTTVEPNETYVVSVGGVTGANIGDGAALGTITNDD